MSDVMETRNSVYEQIMHLLPSLSQTERLALLQELQRQVEAPQADILSDEDFVRQIDQAFGIWAGRTDLPEDSAEYVRQLRATWNERLERVRGETRDNDVNA